MCNIYLLHFTKNFIDTNYDIFISCWTPQGQCLRQKSSVNTVDSNIKLMGAFVTGFNNNKRNCLLLKHILAINAENCTRKRNKAYDIVIVLSKSMGKKTKRYCWTTHFFTSLIFEVRKKDNFVYYFKLKTKTMTWFMHYNIMNHEFSSKFIWKTLLMISFIYNIKEEVYVFH